MFLTQFLGTTLFLMTSTGVIADVSPCSSSPCAHGATCTDVGDRYLCTCGVGYFGRECHEALPCTSGPCLNGGTCGNLNLARYRCTCADGHWGYRCEYSDPCLSTPCLHGGTCVNVNNSTFTCTCTSRYHGNTCEADMPCNSVTCENGGTCRNINTADFLCTCADGYYGEKCRHVKTCEIIDDVIDGRAAYLVASDNETAEAVNYTSAHACECAEGHVWQGEGECAAVCGADTRWSLRAGRCLPVNCGDPPAVANSRHVHTGTTYTSKVRYACDVTHVLHGHAEMTCGEAGGWAPDTPSGDQWPLCVVRLDCGAPPSIKLGRLLITNSTGEFAAARYECHGWSRMIGDGIARCWPTQTVPEVHYCDYCPGGALTLPTTTVRWLYIPRCRSRCSVPHGRPGNATFSTVKVTRCRSRSFDQYQNEACEEPEVFHVVNGQSAPGDEMVFYGADLCVSHKVTKVKYYFRGADGGRKTLGSEVESCKPFCMDGVGGFQRVTVEEALMFSFKSGISVERLVLKYETI